VQTTILLIDDSKPLRTAGERAFARAGFRVVTAKDGEEGLHTAREIVPHLILLDLLLPRMSGLDVLRALKQDANTAHIPVVVLTSLSERNKDKLVREGALAYFEKSSALLENDAAALVKLVANAVGKSPA
jgi:chemosensory pili system protein ChpA (sensor histidine kinase/response regulator)